MTRILPSTILQKGRKENRMKKAALLLLAFVALLALVVMATPATPAAASLPAQASTPAASDTLETCSICHKNSGATHQEYYDQLYQDGVIQVSDIAYAFKANPDTTTITFKLTQNGQPLDPKQVDNINIYWVPYKDGKFQFEPALDRLSLKGKLTADGKGTVTSTLTELAKDDKAFVDYTDVSKTDGLLAIFGRDGTVGTIPNSRVVQNMYPFAGLLQTGAGVDYESSANVAGCVKCHTDPYLKHGYIYGTVAGDTKTDFYTCKTCHVDNGEGGHYEWQLLVNDPKLAAEYLSVSEEEAAKLLTDEMKASMAYSTTVMNDVHMSHAMEFPYPQSMSNCVTCHEGKLDKILTDENFKISTCKSCHPMTGAKAEAAEGAEPAYDTTKLALKTILPDAIHGKMDLNTIDCTTCHGEGKAAPSFKQIHSGYNTTIFTADGIRYSDVISVTIDSAALSGNKLNVKFSAAVAPDFKGIDVTKNMTPTVLASLYGWDTRDFVVGGHERTADTNNDGKIDRSDQSILEAEVGSEHPNVKTIAAADGKWEVEFDLTTWADLLKDGTVKRLEVGVLPKTVNADGVEVAVNATSKTFDIKSNAIDDKAFAPIAETVKCQNCHEALATTFHEPSYGGSVTVCTMCHIVKSGAAHLEMQSRSLESYVHAIHSMQQFDVANIDFKDPTQALEYEDAVKFPYPTHGIGNCESCHAPGTYDVPSQSDALPAILSASAVNDTWDRRIGTVPSVVTGPATTACGGCHRADLINEDKAGELAVLNKHFTQGGYQVPAGENPVDTWQKITDQVMSLFK
jgi:OmcA/MtrC family decaheme c-type cytochrome